MAEITVETKASQPASLTHESRYINRELSRLDFNSRILCAAEDRELPLLERVRFLAILSDALDEFFQVRVAGLKEQVLASIHVSSFDGLTPIEQLRQIRVRAEALVNRQAALFKDGLQPELATAGIRLLTSAEELGKRDRDHLAALFREQIFPVLTPLAVDPAHPFPYISHLSLNLAVLVRDPLRRLQRFARVKVPPLLPRFIALPDGERFVPIELMIGLHVQTLFPGMEIAGQHPFRVTRDADLDLVDNEAEDLLESIQTELRRQRRQAQVVRLEVDPGMTPEVLTLLMRELELEPSDVYTIDGLLDLHGLFSIYALDRPDLKDPLFTPATQPRLRGLGAHPPDFFAALRQGDILVQHPYDSFTTSVEAFISEAARDPSVLAIKQTLYRTSGPASPIALSLAHAAEAGKQVVALVELKARGDEQANIAWAQALEQAGVHVVYGLVGLKTHAKITLVARQEGDRIRHYCHIGTGNYNRSTAHFYEDVGLFSADPELGADLTELFNFLTGYSRQRKFRRLLVAPTGLRNAILRRIREEEPGGRIVIKVNNLADAEIIDALYEASGKQVEIDLVIRGICCLRPGVPGLSEHIHVRSLVGRYLEHSRIFRFGPDPNADYYIGSADLMDRNLDRRVEALTPVNDPHLKMQLAEILDVVLEDDVLAWELGPDGNWTKVPTVLGLDAQVRLQELALHRGNGTVPNVNGSEVNGGDTDASHAHGNDLQARDPNGSEHKVHGGKKKKRG